ncbi:hypothetical protein [Kineococcus rhizosphaerae]|uniref:Uncharacterized protein n=1 Tax=Kineococcus rhizosphaerae TaxID=559628 RepID=A0A2T0RAQ9_9ACTN|nr:hypothetical protein [Kineococcus rhizosphaerae]PRY18244.1 hypothetical protein CLV37_101489 [Kineococcus rhizosphaerae]
MRSQERTSDSAAPATRQRWDGSWDGSWDAALRAVELDVDQAELLIARMHDGHEVSPAPPAADWVAPALLEPLPVEFAERARALLRRQQDVSRRLAEAMVSARVQTRALGRFEESERPPVFVDRAL